MSATFIVSEDTAWMPSIGIYDLALKRIAAELNPGASDLAHLLWLGSSDRRGSVDLETLPADRFQVLQAAADAAFERAIAEYPGAYARPDNVGRFVWLFSDLKAFLHMDPRASGTDREPVCLVIGSSPAWCGPRWLADAVLEHLAGYAWHAGAHELARRLLARRPRTNAPVNLSDLQQLRGTDAAALRAALDVLTRAYGTQVTDSVAPSYSPQVHAALKAIGEALHGAHV